MAMTKRDPEREERRRQQQEIAESLKESGAQAAGQFPGGVRWSV
jgi:hypothetical protein